MNVLHSFLYKNEPSYFFWKFEPEKFYADVTKIPSIVRVSWTI